MNAEVTMKTDAASIESYLIGRFGPLLCGRALWQSLFQHGAGLSEGCPARDLPVRTFRIEHRRGLFAYSAEVALWLPAHTAYAVPNGSTFNVKLISHTQHGRYDRYPTGKYICVALRGFYGHGEHNFQ